jgi:hypothetical protein
MAELKAGLADAISFAKGVPAGPRLVLKDNRLAQTILHRIGQDTADDIGRRVRMRR